MIERPSTRPGKTIGSEATLSRIQRPGSFVLTTIQQMTEVTSTITVSLPKESISVFHTDRPRFGEVKIKREGARERLFSACHEGTEYNLWNQDQSSTAKGSTTISRK